MSELSLLTPSLLSQDRLFRDFAAKNPTVSRKVIRARIQERSSSKCHLPAEIWGLILESIFTVSTLPDGSLDLSPNSALWSALTKDYCLTKCTTQRLHSRPNLAFSANTYIGEFSNIDLLATIFARPTKMVVHLQAPITLLRPSLLEMHGQLCYLPSVQRAQNAMRKVREAVVLAMKCGGASSRSAAFTLPGELVLDSVGATCDCGWVPLAQKDVFRPLIKLMSGSWKTTTKPMKVNILGEEQPALHPSDHHGVLTAVSARQAVKAWGALPTSQFTYW